MMKTNREYEFRAWSPKWNKMIYHGVDGYTIDVMNKTAWLDTCDDESIVLMQYAKEKNTNGEKIFEDDILDNRGELLIVTAVSPFLELSYPDGTTYYNGDYYHDSDSQYHGYESMSIVGNIHENPDLVKT